MSFVNKLFFGIKKLHKELEDTAFLTRYKGNDLQISDHYRHLCQLLEMYTVIEKKLRHKNFYPKLPEAFQYLLDQSTRLKADLTFLETHFARKIDKKKEVLESTQAFVDKVEKIEIEKDVFNYEIFGYFLSRIFGDLEGGQSIKEYVLNMYARNGMNLEGKDKKAIISGVNFYCFPEDTLKDFSKWCDKLEFPTKSDGNDLGQTYLTNENLNKIIDCTNQSLADHLPIFNELEKTRKVSSSINIPASLFSYRNVAIGTTVLVAGVALTAHCYAKTFGR